MSSSKLYTVIAAAGLCWVGMPSALQAHTPSPRILQEQGRHEFMTMAAQTSIAEIRLGNLAQRRASSPAVRRFAERMVEDHRGALNEMKRFAEMRNFDMHVGMGDEHRDLYNRLQGLRGREFDRAYMRAMVEGHEKAVHDFEAHVDSHANNRFNQWVQNKIPTLRHHLQMARNVYRRIS